MNLLSPNLKNYNLTVHVAIKCAEPGCPGYCILDEKQEPFHADFERLCLVAPVSCTQCNSTYGFQIVFRK